MVLRLYGAVAFRKCAPSVLSVHSVISPDSANSAAITVIMAPAPSVLPSSFNIVYCFGVSFIRFMHWLTEGFIKVTNYFFVYGASSAHHKSFEYIVSF